MTLWDWNRFSCYTPDGGTDGGADAGSDGGSDAGSDAGGDAGTDAGADAGAPPPVTLLCAWGTFGCISCCEFTSAAGSFDGLSCSTPIDCTAVLGSLADKSFPGGGTYVYSGDFNGGGIAVFQVDTSTSPPGMTPLSGVPDLAVLEMEEFGDPFLYAQAHPPDAGGAFAPNSLYQFSIGSNGSLTPLAPASVSGLIDGQPLANSNTGYMYSAYGNQVGQWQIQDGGQVIPLSPPSVTNPAQTSFFPPIAMAPSISTLYVGSYLQYSDGGQQPVVSQFIMQPNGTLAAGNPPVVNVPYAPDSIAVVTPDGGVPFVYVLGRDPAFNEHLSQFSASSGTLVPNTPPTVAVCNNTGNIVQIAGLPQVAVACTGLSQLWVYDIATNGTLTAAAWSPAAMPLGPGQIIIFTTQ